MTTQPPATEPPRDVKIAIVGAGMSGLRMAIALRDDGIEDFVVLERAGDLGGTWRDNTYPGCACDIPSHLYSYADEQNPDWTRVWSPQPEIWDYMRDVTRRHGIEPFIRYDHDVVAADWDGERQRWQVETTGGAYTAEVVIAATGPLADPSIPSIPGLDTFDGAVFHSARWDHERDLTGRRVAVVGTGASAIQFVPEIAPQVQRLTVFQRTPPWVLPRANPEIPERWRRRLREHPRLLHLFRDALFSAHEFVHFGFSHPSAMRLIERRARANIAKHVADPALREQLTPHYRLGCKRILNSDRWYSALCRPNVDVVTAGITRVTPSGVVDGAGVEHPVDTIIFGTGFLVTDPPISHRTRGRDGTLLSDGWEGSPQAHLGMSVSGYPNLFLLLGPNTGLGHNSVLLMIEAQIGYLRQLLAYRRLQGLATLEPTPAAQAGYVGEVERGTEGSVWVAGGCLSWYVDATGRNSTLWPGSVRAYERRLARFDAGDYATELPRPQPAPEHALA